MTAIDPNQLSNAERLLWSYGVSEPAHIDLEAIAFEHNAFVRYRKLDGCEARLVVNGDRALISVNQESNEGRRRFSLGHELGHWICDQGSFRCINDDIGPQNAEAKTAEATANSFASQLVLPDYLVRPWVDQKPATLDTASDLAAVFRVSLTAAAIKLVRRSVTPACVACHGQRRLHWFQKNRAFPSEYFVVRELHADTDAFTSVFGGTAGRSRPKREAAARWLTGPDVFRMTVQTQSVRLPEGSVLTIIAMCK
jgi:Zn-dependent peptidase ImmA (M78 family)